MSKHHKKDHKKHHKKDHKKHNKKDHKKHHGHEGGCPNCKAGW